jgi:hypothetical protein
VLFRTVVPRCGLWGKYNCTKVSSDTHVRLRAEINQLGVYVLSAVAQFRDDKTLAVNSLGKFICVMTGYAGGESTSQIVISRPSPNVEVQKTASDI